MQEVGVISGCWNLGSDDNDVGVGGGGGAQHFITPPGAQNPRHVPDYNVHYFQVFRDKLVTKSSENAIRAYHLGKLIRLRGLTQ